MTGIKKCKPAFLTIFILTFYARGSEIKFQAYPSIIKTNLTSSVSMRCSLADSQQNIGRRDVTNSSVDVKRVTAIFITNSNGDDVASVSPFDAPVAYIDIGNLDVKGEVTGTSSEGYLELSWRDISAMALGGYECKIRCSDEHNHHVVFSSTIEMTEVAPSISDVIIELKNQKLELENQNKQLENQKQQLESQLENQKQKQISDFKKHDGEIKDLKQCMSRKSGFMAVMSSGKTVPAGQTAVFDKVIYTSGGGYNPSTGIFTCDEPGIYSFSVTALSRAIVMHIMLNSDQITSAAYANGDSFVNTAATSALVHLVKNDTVRVKAGDGGPSVFFYGTYLPLANVFVGQLEHSDCVN